MQVISGHLLITWKQSKNEKTAKTVLHAWVGACMYSLSVENVTLHLHAKTTPEGRASQCAWHWMQWHMQRYGAYRLKSQMDSQRHSETGAVQIIRDRYCWFMWFFSLPILFFFRIGSMFVCYFLPVAQHQSHFVHSGSVAESLLIAIQLSAPMSQVAVAAIAVICVCLSVSAA